MILGWGGIQWQYPGPRHRYPWSFSGSQEKGGPRPVALPCGTSRDKLARRGSGSRGHCETTQPSTRSQVQGISHGRVLGDLLLSRPQTAHP